MGQWGIETGEKERVYSHTSKYIFMYIFLKHVFCVSHCFFIYMFFFLLFQIFEVYHFKNTSNTLFRSFIDRFLKIKQESSGWPAGCVTEEQKMEYIRQYEEKEGVKLDPVCISKNPGRRQVAKLALNSFWGR